MPDSEPISRNDIRGEEETSSPPTAPSRSAESHEGLMARLLRAFGVKASTTRQELEEVLEEGATSDESGFSPQEQALLKNILGLRERQIEDVLVPRADIVAVQQEIPLGDLVKVFENAAHSRLVVYNDSLDDPVGMVHIRDLVAFITTRAAVKPDAAVQKRAFPAGLDLRKIDLSMPLSSTGIVRRLLFVPPSMPAIDLLAKMQATRIHLALVIDEYGGTDGLVSIEDVVELIVGDIDDEHDEEEPPTIARQANGSFIADARTGLEEVVAAIGEEFDVGDALDEVDTLGGYVVTLAGHVPVRGEVLQGPGPFELEVLDADPRRVKRVKIRNRKTPKPEREREATAREDLPSVADVPATLTEEPEADTASQKGARRS